MLVSMRVAVPTAVPTSYSAEDGHVAISPLAQSATDYTTQPSKTLRTLDVLGFIQLR